MKLKGKQEKGFEEEIGAFLAAVREGGKPPIELGAIQKSYMFYLKKFRNFWTQVKYLYNMQGHGLAVNNTGAYFDRGRRR